MAYTRNSNLLYYEEYPDEANCGSYALRLNEWYDPEYYFEVTEGEIYSWIEEKFNEGYEDWEISTIYGKILAEGMLKEFQDELELCNGNPAPTNDVELIAFNTFCGNYSYGYDYDFHFKVFRDGKWMEKCGTGPVKECELDEWGDYIGNTIFFYHGVTVENEM